MQDHNQVICPKDRVVPAHLRIGRRAPLVAVLTLPLTALALSAGSSSSVGAPLGAVGVSSAAAAQPARADASEVTHWNEVATSTLGALPGPDGGAPPAFSINMGMVQGAVYDAVNAIGPKQHRPYLLDRRTGARASIDAAVATAAYDVISSWSPRHRSGCRSPGARDC